jgi:hypothetical protein
VSAGEAAFSAATLLGPVGGMIGLAFAAGASAGWLFAERTVLKLTRKQVDDLREDGARRDADCKREIFDLKNEVNGLRERERMGLERLLAQHHESSYRLLSDGKEETFEVPPAPPRRRR